MNDRVKLYCKKTEQLPVTTSFDIRPCFWPKRDECHVRAAISDKPAIYLSEFYCFRGRR